MNPAYQHHIVVFPECRLHFEYPAELKPSPDFLHQRLDTVVDYGRIRWGRHASQSFVAMHADLPGRTETSAVATLSVEMWLCAAPAGFAGDVSRADDLMRANRELDRADGIAESELRATILGGQTWVYRARAGSHLLGLNHRIYLAVRVALVGGTVEASVRQTAREVRDRIIGSLRVESAPPAELMNAEVTS